MRKFFLFLTVSSLISFLIWFFLIQETYRPPYFSVQPIEAIPQNTPIILEFEDFYLLRHEVTKMPYATELSAAFFVKKMSEDFNVMRQLFSKNYQHLQLLLNSPITAGLHLSGKDNVDFLYVLKDKTRDFNLNDLLEGYTYKKSIANQNTVYQLEIENGINYTVTIFKDLILISKFAYLVESAMNQLNNPSGNLLQDQRLKFLNKPDRKKDQIGISILFDNLKAFSNPFINKKATKYLKYFSDKISSGFWILDFDKEGIVINGCLKSKKSSLEYVFNNNKITNSKCLEVLPENISYFFRNSIKGNFDKSDDDFFDEFFFPWIGEEWLVGRSEVFTRKMNAEKFVAYQIHAGRKKMAEYYLQKLTDSLGIINSWSYQTYSIRQVKAEKLPIPFIKESESLSLGNYCYTFLGDYVIFAGAPRILENWIDQYNTNQVLASHIPYLKMKGQAGSNGTLEFYLNTVMSQAFWVNFFDAKDSQALSQIKIWEQFPTIGMNATWKKGEFLTEGFLYHEEEKRESIKVKWRTPLKNKANTKPFPIFNDEEGAYNILVQDEENILYLLSQGGEIIWEKQLELPIQSEIKAANFFSDTSVGIIFNTSKKIYLLDLSGKERNNFPLSLSSPISNNILLADYGENDFGIFVACENEMIYGFDKEGIPLSGWNSIEGAGLIKNSIEHFLTEDKNYIVAVNVKGDMFVFGKDGFVVKKIEKVTTKNSKPLLFQFGKLDERVVVSDKNGAINIYELNTSKMTNIQQDMVIPSKEIKYTSADIGGDNFRDYAMLSNNKLTIYYYHKDKFQEYGNYQFSNEQDELFGVQSDQMGKAMIGSLSKKQNQIFLLDKKGNLEPGFPLSGSSKFDLLHLFADDQKSLLVADGHQIVVYELP